MRQHSVKIISLNSPVLIGRFMTIFSRRRVEVTNYSFSKLNNGDGQFTIDFVSDDHMAMNIQKQLDKQLDIFETTLN